MLAIFSYHIADLQHQHWLINLRGALFVAPIDPKQRTRVLDIGCGCGGWALTFSKENLNSIVTAVDVDPPLVDSLPTNCSFVKANHEHEWLFAADKTFEFVHVRLMTMITIHDWPAFLARCWKHLAPGGWLEIVDVHHPFAALNPKANPETSAFLRVGASMELAWARRGWDLRACEKHPDRLALLGFQKVSQQNFQGLIGDWPEKEPEKTSGRLVWEHWNEMMREHDLTNLAKALHMEEAAIKASIEEMLDDLQANGARMQYYFPE